MHVLDVTRHRVNQRIKMTVLLSNSVSAYSVAMLPVLLLTTTKLTNTSIVTGSDGSPTFPLRFMAMAATRSLAVAGW